MATEILYLGRSNTIDLLLRAEDENGVMQPVNLSTATRMTITFGDVLVSSYNGTTSPITWAKVGYDVGEVRLALGGQSIRPGYYEAALVVYDPAHPSGLDWGAVAIQVWSDREGVLPPPISFSADGKLDGAPEEGNWALWHPGGSDVITYVTGKKPIGYTSSMKAFVNDWFEEFYWWPWVDATWPGVRDFEFEILMAVEGAVVPAYTVLQFLNARRFWEGFGIEFFGAGHANEGKIQAFLSYAMDGAAYPMRYLGSAVTPGCTFTSEEFFNLKVRKVGTLIQVKMWADGSVEPVTWDIAEDFAGHTFEPMWDEYHQVSFTTMDFGGTGREWWIAAVDVTFL